MIGDTQYRRELRAELLCFAARARTADGFGNLDADGVISAGEPTQLYVTCRMTHVFCLGLLADEPPAPGGPGRDELEHLAAHGIQALVGGALKDQHNGGWFDANPDTGRKTAYAHAFVLLAASSGVTAGIDGSADLLAEASGVHLDRFFDEAEGLVVDDWESDWSRCDTYRGLNSNMHTVEAFLAVGDATGDRQWYDRALGICRRVTDWAAANQWRIPEHFSSLWEPLLEYNAAEPAHPFRPYGATVGHGLEWARLLVSTALAVGEEGRDLVGAAVSLADRAIADGWARDGADGFVYTTDWSGAPVTHERMHWVLCEAIAASSVLHRATGHSRFGERLAQWWLYADRYLIDRDGGSWHHELDRKNKPSGITWPGKPDAYHAYQACIVQDLPLAPSFARALVEVGQHG